MKIIQTPCRFSPYIGGTEQVCFFLSRELAKRGHDVKIICANEPPVDDGVIENIEIKRIPYIGKIANTNITLSLPKKLLKEDFDIIHTHLPHPWSADISAIVTFVKRKPLFLTYHNDITGRGLNRIIANLYNGTALKFLLKKADKIFITHKNYLKTSPFLKPFRNKIVITPPGVDLEKFKPLNLPKIDENIIFFISKLDKFHRYKGLSCLLMSIKKLTRRMSLKLYVGGEGELLNYYQKFVKKNGLEKIVFFLGYLDDEKLVRYYNLCDVFVLPSISSVQEGFGLVALEAMACGKPVIATNIVGVAEDVKNYNAGIVISPKNTEILSEALMYLLTNKEEAKEKGKNALNLIKKKYTWENHVDIVEREYLKAVK